MVKELKGFCDFCKNRADCFIKRKIDEFLRTIRPESILEVSITRCPKVEIIA